MPIYEQISIWAEKETNVRRLNILNSPKRNGNGWKDSKPYLKELGIEILDCPQPIQFLKNSTELVHRWSPYVQGFSARFVQRTFDIYKDKYNSPVIFDPFAGSGTVLVQAKLNNFESIGVELNPLLHFIAQTKVDSWKVNPDKLLFIAMHLEKKHTFQAPKFLKSEKHFKPAILKNLEIIKSGIDNFSPSNEEEKIIKNLMLVAFSAILIDNSNLKRTPCLGYTKNKVLDDDFPFKSFYHKIREMVSDLKILQSQYRYNLNCKSHVFLANSKYFNHQKKYDLVITSPPYMNGLDYVMNYKIEMGWLNFAENHKELKQVKDEMVVCDNVSKSLIKHFSDQRERYTNDWIEDIKLRIQKNIERRGNYRRPDMPEIVHKYFDDMYIIMKNVSEAVGQKGRFILVVGDSLIADVYVPTDLLVARIGQELGFQIEKIEKARDRRSGQIRTYKLRESIVTLLKY